MVHSWNPDMIMYLGDVYQRGMPDEFMNFYNPLYGPDAYRTITTVGNHEYKQLTDAQRATSGTGTSPNGIHRRHPGASRAEAAPAAAGTASTSAGPPTTPGTSSA